MTLISDTVSNCVSLAYPNTSGVLQKNGAACEDSPMNNSNSCGEGVRFGIAARDLALERRIIFGHAAAPKPTPGRSRKKRLRRGSHRLSTVAVFQESEISVAGASRKGRSAVAVSGPGGREPNESHRRDHAFNLFGVHSEKLDGFPARSSDAFLENEGRREAAVNQRMTPCKTGGPKRMMMDRCNRTLKRLRCKVRGFPFPIIYWKRNNVLLQPTQDYRITQKKRRSTLAIRRHPEADSEWYECVARDVDGNEISHVFPPIKKPKERNHTGTSTTSTESPNLGRGKIDTAAHPSESPKDYASRACNVSIRLVAVDLLTYTKGFAGQVWTSFKNARTSLSRTWTIFTKNLQLVADPRSPLPSRGGSSNQVRRGITKVFSNRTRDRCAFLSLVTTTGPSRPKCANERNGEPIVMKYLGILTESSATLITQYYWHFDRTYTRKHNRASTVVRCQNHYFLTASHLTLLWIPCKPEMDRVYCRNGGTCFYEEVIKEYSCECANGYRGRRCEEKSSDQSSMYRQNPLYTCNVGLYTKYDGC
ncbi:hypothetical protein GEV33_006630 [Tenebrio molitor]|uniref:Protein vein n=1 Tax=Tenebrio molitor TaxID=7067 RepID=A0A8J6HKW4_TENMO|nr:hypothetical protein GEV33_006630 [Tenebrio molitor]